MFTIPRSGHGYLGFCTFILASSFFWASLTPSGPCRLSKLQHLVLTQCLIKIMLNALFSNAFYFLHADFIICFLLIAKTLNILHYTSNTFAVLVCLVTLSQRCLDPSFIQEHSKEFASLPRVFRRL